MTLHGRVVAPTLFAVGVLGVVTGIAALALGAPVLGVVELAGGALALRAARAVWRHDEHQRRNGWPE